MNDETQALVDRIAAGTHTEADLAALRRALLISGQGNVVQVGKYSIQIGEGHKIRIGDIYQGSDVSAIKTALRAVFQEQTKVEFPALDEAEAAYRQQVIAAYNHLDFSGFPQPDRGPDDSIPDLRLDFIPLDQVFVDLSLTVERERVVRIAIENSSDSGKPKQSRLPKASTNESTKEPRKRESTRRQPLPEDEPEKGQTSITSEQHGKLDDPKREEIRIERLQEPITLAQVLAKNALITGEPGAGKSTLLRWLAVTFARGRQQVANRLGLGVEADRLPAYVELGGLPEEYRRGEGGKTPKWSELLPELTVKREGFDETVAPVVRQALLDGRCLLLCDGLDEVADRTARRRIAGSLAEFGRLYPGNRVIIGSRPAGIWEVEGPLGMSFQRCQIRRFSPEQLHSFFQFRYSLDTTLSEEARMAEADKLYDEVQTRPAVAKLATTPLLAAIVLLIRRNEGRLPGRRVELYERCCEILIENWEASHDVEYVGVLRELGWERHLRLLAPLAYTIHAREQRTSATRAELIPVLATTLLQERLCTDKVNATREAERFLAALGLRSGLLQRVGLDEYGFPHLAFQEYLSARYIAAQSYPDFIDLFMAHLHEGWWRDVHVLTIGSLGTAMKEADRLSSLLLEILHLYPPPRRFVQPDSLIDEGQRFPGFQLSRRVSWLLGRELELVARGILEAELDSVSPAVRELSDSLSWRFVANHLGRGTWNAYLEERQETLTVLAQANPRIVQHLLELVDSSSIDTSADAAEVLLDLGRVTKVAVERRVRELAHAENEDQRRIAGEHLDELDLQHPVTVRTLTAILETSDEAPLRVRRWAAELLGRAGKSGEEAIPVLCASLLCDDSVWRLHETAALSLGQLGYARKEVVDALELALDDKEAGCAAALSLIRLGVVAQSSPLEEKVIAALRTGPIRRSSPEVVAHLTMLGMKAVEPLIDLLEEDDAVEGAASASLVYLGQTDARVRLALVRAIEHPSCKIRKNAARILGELGQASPEILNALARALRESAYSDPNLTKAAAESLGLLGQATPEILDGLTYCIICSSEDVRQACSASIGRLVRTVPEATLELLRAARRSPFFLPSSRLLSDSIAEALNTPNTICPQAVDRLIGAFDDDDQELRWLAARILVNLTKANTTGLPALVQATRSASTLRRRLAVSTLGMSGTNDMDAIRTLSSALNDADNVVRLLAAESLGQLGHRNTQAVQVLQDYLDASDWRWRNDAASTLVEWHLADSKVIDVLLAQIQAEDVEARRCAALILGELAEPTPEALSALLAALKDEQQIVRWAASRSLGQLGVSSLEIVRGLKVALDDSDRDVRSAAAVSLGQVRPATSESTRALIKAFNDKEWPVRRSAMQGLAERIETEPEIESAFAGALEDNDDTIRAEAIRCLGSMSAVGPRTAAAMARVAVAELARGQRAGDHYSYQLLRNLTPADNAMPAIADGIARALLEGNLKPDQRAIELLGRAGKPSPRVLKALIQACSNEDPIIQEEAATSLGQLGHGGAKVTEALLRLLNHERSWVSETAVESLSTLGVGNPLLLQPLLERLGSDHYGTWSGARDCLDKVHVIEPEAIDLLVDALRSADRSVRAAGARLLGKLRSSSSKVVEALVTALADEEFDVCDAAAESLGELSQTNPQAAQALVGALHGVVDMQRAAKESLDRWAPLSPSIAEALLNDLDRHDRASAIVPPGLVQLHRTAAASAGAWAVFVRRRDVTSGKTLLSSVGELGLTALTALWYLLYDTPPRNTPCASWHVLQSLKPSSPAVTVVLLPALECRGPMARSSIALALNRSEGGRTPLVLHELCEALASPYQDIRLAAATALSQSDDVGAPEVVHALTKAQEDEALEVRRVSAIALAQTGNVDLSVIRNLLSGLNHQDSTIRQKALENLKRIHPTQESQLIQILTLLVRRLHRGYLSSGDPTYGLISQLLNGRPLPGYRWAPIREREKQHRRRLQLAKVVGVAAVILLVAALWTAAQEELGADSRIMAFVAATAGLVALLGAVAEVLGYFRGRTSQG